MPLLPILLAAAAPNAGPPRMVEQALTCALIKDDRISSDGKVRGASLTTYAFSRYRNSTPHIVLIVRSSRTNFLIYNVRVSSSRTRSFRLVNNAEFTWRAGELNFVDPPLGGVWTQDKLIEAAQAARAARRYRVGSAVRSGRAGLDCSSYADR